MDRSPIPPERASGEMRRKGTAVVTTLIGSISWALRDCSLIPRKRVIAKVTFKAVDLIVIF
jgi:hypothetical protein